MENTCTEMWNSCSFVSPLAVADSQESAQLRSGMSAKKEKSCFLESCLFSMPAGYARITVALCRHTWSKPWQITQTLFSTLNKHKHTDSMTNNGVFRHNAFVSLLSLFSSPLLWTHQCVCLCYHLKQHPGTLAWSSWARKKWAHSGLQGLFVPFVFCICSLFTRKVGRRPILFLGMSLLDSIPSSMVLVILLTSGGVQRKGLW